MPTFGTTAQRLSRRTFLALTAAPLAILTTWSRADEDGIAGVGYVCTTPDCAPYIYDPAIGNPSQGIPPGTPFEALPDTWRCPSCGSAHDAFIRIG